MREARPRYISPSTKQRFLSLSPSLSFNPPCRLRVNKIKRNNDNNNNNNNRAREHVFDVTFQLIRDLVEQGREEKEERRGWNNNRGN